MPAFFAADPTKNRLFVTIGEANSAWLSHQNLGSIDGFSSGMLVIVGVVGDGDGDGLF